MAISRQNVLTAFLLVGSATLAVLTASSIVGTVQQSLSDLEADKVRLADLRIRASSLDLLRSELDQLNAVDLLRAGFLIADNEQAARVQLQQRVTEAARTAGGEITSLRPHSSTEMETGALTLGLELTIRLERGRLEAFILDIENRDFVVLIDRLRIEAPRGAADSKIQIEMQLRAVVHLTERTS